MIDFSGKKGVILGVGNPKSIAWFVTECLHAQGAEIALTYLTDPKSRFENNVRRLGKEVDASIIQECDVSNDNDIKTLIQVLNDKWGKLDFLVHSLAYAEQEDLGGSFSQTRREGFLKALEISAFSLLPLCAGVAPLMKETGKGSIVTMSFIGSIRAVPSYNVMGPAKAALESSVRYLARELGPDNIRVNSLSAGPIRTLSSAGIKNFSTMLKEAKDRTALKRNVQRSEVANTAAFLCHDVSSGITGQTVYVDCGYSIMGD